MARIKDIIRRWVFQLTQLGILVLVVGLLLVGAHTSILRTTDFLIRVGTNVAAQGCWAALVHMEQEKARLRATENGLIHPIESR